MITLKCLVVDDEPLARIQIERYIEQVPYLECVGAVRNAVSCKQLMETVPVDLLFLDIAMPGLSGLEFLRGNHLLQQVIIITAFPAHAIEGFELDVTDYLVKPVTLERFTRAAEKAYTRISGNNVLRYNTSKPDFFYAKCNKTYRKIRFNEILFIESMLNYISIVTPENSYVVYASLKMMEELLPREQFMRVHKSFIVPLAKINTIGTNQVQIGAYTVPVSRGSRNDLLTAAFKLGIPIN